MDYYNASSLKREREKGDSKGSLSQKEQDEDNYRYLIGSYLKQMEYHFMDSTTVQKPLDIWIPYTYPDIKFEAFIKEQGYVYKFAKQCISQSDGSFELVTGYLIVETNEALIKNKRDLD